MTGKDPLTYKTSIRLFAMATLAKPKANARILRTEMANLGTELDEQITMQHPEPTHQQAKQQQELKALFQDCDQQIQGRLDQSD
jgi:hypothetical protein